MKRSAVCQHIISQWTGYFTKSLKPVYAHLKTETATEIHSKHRQKKKPWVTAEILDLCNKRRVLRKKRLKPEGYEKYKAVNNNIKRCMKKAKENWIGQQCSETEENLRKNNSKRAYQLVKDKESYYYPRLFRKMPD